jgi:hypothetical protein
MATADRLRSSEAIILTPVRRSPSVSLLHAKIEHHIMVIRGHRVMLDDDLAVSAGSRTKGLLMAYKLLDMAQARWRRLDGAHLLPLVRDGSIFVDGVPPVRKRNKPRARAA